MIRVGRAVTLVALFSVINVQLAEAAKKKVKAGPSSYIQQRYLENRGKLWIGPFARSLQSACFPAIRESLEKAYFTGPHPAGNCADGQPVVRFDQK